MYKKKLRNTQLSLINPRNVHEEIHDISTCDSHVYFYSKLDQQALKSMTTGFLRDVINLELLEAGKSPFVSMIDCTMMFPLCM